MPMTDAELYEDLNAAEIEEMKGEVADRYDPLLVQESYRRLRNLSKEQWQDLKEEGESITRAIAALIDLDPVDPAVQEWIGRHYEESSKKAHPL